MSLPENSNWVFDCSLIVDDIGAGAGDFSAEGAGGLFWTPQGVNCPSNASVENSVSLVDSTGFKESNSKKRVRAESCSVPGSKACREKMRRDRLNDRFLELGSILEPGKPLKMDKAAILNDAVRMVTQLRSEAEKLKDSNESLQEKIKELKALCSDPSSLVNCRSSVVKGDVQAPNRREAMFHRLIQRHARYLL